MLKFVNVIPVTMRYGTYEMYHLIAGITASNFTEFMDFFVSCVC